MPAPLPLELHNHIFSFLPTNADLRMVCLVSHALLHEARRWLYRSPTLPAANYIPPFALTVVNRPHIAVLVRSLTLRCHKNFTDMRNQASDDIVHAMLMALTSLKCLSVEGLDAGMLATLLTGCTFRLKSLHIRNGRDLQAGRVIVQLANVLATSQPEITEWVYDPRSYRTTVFPANFLPQLRTLSLPMILVSTVPYHLWAIVRLHIDVTMMISTTEDRLNKIFGHFGPTLESLSLIQQSNPRSMLDLVSLLSPHLTELRFLSIRDGTSESPDETEIVELPESGWVALKRLQTFIWWTIGGHNLDWNPFEEDPPPHPEDANRLSSKFATQLAETCPSIERFVFMSREDDEGFTWNTKGVREQFLWRRVKEDQDYTSNSAWMWA